MNEINSHNTFLFTEYFIYICMLTYINNMTITEFKDKVVSALSRNFQKTGELKPVFLYVTQEMEFKSVDMGKLVSENSKEYIALLLKQYTKKEKPLFTAYITHSEMKTINPKDIEDYIEKDDDQPEDQYKIETIPTIAIDIVDVSTKKGKGERILMNFQSVGTSDKPELQLLNEIHTKLDKGSLPNLI
jgi:D-ribose pyranose/furanose isomerase RbsD